MKCAQCQKGKDTMEERPVTEPDESEKETGDTYQVKTRRERPKKSDGQSRDLQ